MKRIVTYYLSHLYFLMSLGKLDAKTRSIHEFAVSGHIVKVQQPISGTFLSILYRFVLAAWPSGKAGDCKSFFPSSNPGVACSTLINKGLQISYSVNRTRPIIPSKGKKDLFDYKHPVWGFSKRLASRIQGNLLIF